MSENKKLTIITVCYNEPNLEATCESIVNQTWQDFEWIVVDGGSNEETQKIWNKYKYRIDTFISEPDTGIYNAMNKGIKIAKGKYLNFLNAGDYYYNNCVLNNIFKKHNYDEDILYGDIMYLADKEYLIRKNCKLSKSFFINTTIGHQSSFIKNEIFYKYGMYDENIKISSCHDLYVKCFLGNAKFKYIPIIMTYCDGHGASSKTGYLEQQKREDEMLKNKYFTPEDIQKAQQELYKKRNMPKFKFSEQLFSVRNSKDKKYKILTVLGIHIKFENNKQ